MIRLNQVSSATKSLGQASSKVWSAKGILSERFIGFCVACTQIYTPSNISVRFFSHSLGRYHNRSLLNAYCSRPREVACVASSKAEFSKILEDIWNASRMVLYRRRLYWLTNHCCSQNSMPHIILPLPRLVSLLHGTCEFTRDY